MLCRKRIVNVSSNGKKDIAMEWLSDRIQGIKLSAIREVLSKIEAARQRGITVTNFSIGRPDFDTPEHIKAATKSALDEGHVHYTASAGIPGLRKAVCRRLEEDFEIKIKPSEVIITNGATEAIYIGLQSILNPGDEVIVPEPMYVYYTGWSFLGGAKCVSIPLNMEDGFVLKPDRLREYISDKTKVLILNSPNNPTGQVYEKEDLVAIAELAVKHDIMVISDDIYNQMVYGDVNYFPIVNAPGMKERTLIIGSFSKSYAMDGWRIGYLIAPQALIDEAMKMHQHIVSCPNSFVQFGAQTALEASQECVKEMVSEFDRRRQLIVSYLDDMGMPYVRPRGAFYVFPSIEKYGVTSKAFSDLLLDEAQVAVVPGNAFGASGEGYIRISYSTSYEDIEKGMERVNKALSRL